MPGPGRLAPFLLVVAALSLGIGWSVGAQESVPDGDARIDHPAYLQTGTCEQPGLPIAALASTSTGTESRPRTDLDAPAAPAGPEIPAAVSVTDLDQPLGDLLADERIVRVVESADEPAATIACGSIGGQPDDDGNLYLALTERADSGVSGVVWFQGDGDTTTVTVFLIPTGTGPTPAPGGQA